MKKCTKCKEEKLLEKFYKNKFGKYVAECRACSKIRSDKWHQNNPEKTRIAQKKYELKLGIGVPVACKRCGEMFVKKTCSSLCSIKCRLLSKVHIKKDTKCWIWQGLLAGEYGKTTLEGKTMSAHRTSYMVFKGEVDSGLCVCHSCDNKLCINPEHLYLATSKENFAHAVERGRINFKQINGHFKKFTETQTDEMRRLKEEGFTYERLAGIFNCSIPHLFKVVKKYYRR